jgi:TldD protein
MLCGRAWGDDDVVLSALQAELVRTMEAWKGDPAAPYYLSYRVRETQRWRISARFGALASSTEDTTRTLDVSARVGSPELDSTHPLKGDFVALGNFHMGQGLPFDGTTLALQEAVWRATSKELADAQERWLRVQTNFVVKVVDDHPSADFTVMPRVVDVGEKASLVLEPERYEPMLVELSAALDRHPDIHRSSADLHAVSQTEYFVSSEGTVLRHPREWLRVSLQASTTLQDGAELELYRWKDVSAPEQLPERAELERWASELQRDLLELREAPKGEPYSGPVLLRGRAAGVFVHEVLGHRIEGHRQKDDEEGQTFTDKVGQAILPSFVTVYDDPTLGSYAGEQLNGHYLYDQEGVPAQRATLVDKGVLQGFLMSRSPLEGFSSSNGHGRAQSYAQPVARMANTILETSKPTPMAALRAQMVRELRSQGRPWGLVVDEIEGGFTLTGRIFPNAFNVRAVTAWKVYADGRPDERIRGIDLVGTPLVALSNVMAVGDDPAVFNGFCGAESGSVPNSAVSPSLLLRTLEVQKKEKDADRPPLLAKPSDGGDT